MIGPARDGPQGQLSVGVTLGETMLFTRRCVVEQVAIVLECAMPETSESVPVRDSVAFDSKRATKLPCHGKMDQPVLRVTRPRTKRAGTGQAVRVMESALALGTQRRFPLPQIEQPIVHFENEVIEILRQRGSDYRNCPALAGTSDRTEKLVRMFRLIRSLTAFPKLRV